MVNALNLGVILLVLGLLYCFILALRSAFHTDSVNGSPEGLSPDLDDRSDEVYDA